MSKLISILSLFLIFSCGNVETVEISKEEYAKLTGRKESIKAITPIVWECEYKTITIDSCEYIFMETVSGHGGIALTHKGGCEFCAKIKLKDEK